VALIAKFDGLIFSFSQVQNLKMPLSTQVWYLKYFTIANKKIGIDFLCQPSECSTYFKAYYKAFCLSIRGCFGLLIINNNDTMKNNYFYF
jgi:hypothetical protein